MQHTLEIIKITSYHVGGEDQHPLVFSTRPLGVIEEVRVVVGHIFHTWKWKYNNQNVPCFVIE